MAKGTAHCKCKVCGEEFTKEKKCYNRKDADAFEAWTEKNITVCPTCYKNDLEADKALKFQEIKKNVSLPQITGVSDKQISYAETLRKRALLENPSTVEKIKNMMLTLKPDVLKKLCEKHGKTEAEMILIAMQERRLDRVYIAMYCTDAGAIIKALK